MKCMSIKARLALFAVFFGVPLVFAGGDQIDRTEVTTTQTESILLSHQAKQFTSDTEVLNDVLGTIKQELKQSDGDAYLVECTYRMHNNKPISASTKTYRTGYRRKASHSEKKFSSNHNNKNQAQTVEPNQIIEVVYKPSIRPKQVSVTTKNPSKPGRRLTSKTVNLRQSLVA